MQNLYCLKLKHLHLNIFSDDDLGRKKGETNYSCHIEKKEKKKEPVYA